MIYTHQVNYSQRFVAGLLTGKVYHAHLRFTSLADADAFAAREGEVLNNCATTGDYRIEDTQVIDLSDFA